MTTPIVTHVAPSGCASNPIAARFRALELQRRAALPFTANERQEYLELICVSCEALIRLGRWTPQCARDLEALLHQVEDLPTIPAYMVADPMEVV